MSNNCAPFLSLIWAILLTISFSCSPKNKISHLGFLDAEGTIYYVGDTNHKQPFNDMALYYLVGQSNIKDIEFSKIEKFISEDSLIQNTIKKKYATLDITFYKKSKNID